MNDFTIKHSPSGAITLIIANNLKASLLLGHVMWLCKIAPNATRTDVLSTGGLEASRVVQRLSSVHGFTIEEETLLGVNARVKCTLNGKNGRVIRKSEGPLGYLVLWDIPADSGDGIFSDDQWVAPKYLEVV